MTFSSDFKLKLAIITYDESLYKISQEYSNTFACWCHSRIMFANSARTEEPFERTRGRPTFSDKLRRFQFCHCRLRDPLVTRSLLAPEQLGVSKPVQLWYSLSLERAFSNPYSIILAVSTAVSVFARSTVTARARVSSGKKKELFRRELAPARVSITWLAHRIARSNRDFFCCFLLTDSFRFFRPRICRNSFAVSEFDDRLAIDHLRNSALA